MTFGGSMPAEERLQRALAHPALIPEFNYLIAQAAGLVSHHPPEMLEAIAVHLERVISGEKSRRSAEYRSGPLGPGDRYACSDVDFWLWSGAQDGPPPPGSGIPPETSRAEYLATLVVWKATTLWSISRSLKDPEAVARDAWLHAGIEAVQLLTMEITQAATMALEAHYFEAELKKARAAGADERERALLDARDVHVRQAGARGGAMRAAKYGPAKRRAVELYSAPTASYRSRLAAAEAIAAILAREGLHSKFDFVLQALKDHDKALEEARARRVDGRPEQGL